MEQSGERYVEIVLEYLLEQGEIPSQADYINLIKNEISLEIGDKVMTLGQQLRAEGRQEGFQEGKEQERILIAKTLLAENLDLAFIAKVTQLPIAQIKQL